MSMASLSRGRLSLTGSTRMALTVGIAAPGIVGSDAFVPYELYFERVNAMTVTQHPMTLVREGRRCEPRFRAGGRCLLVAAAGIVLSTYPGTTPGNAQPSGGPYGPLRQTYALPETTGRIHFVAPDGKAEVAGESLSRPTTLDAAITRVKSGDAIVLRGGTYRTGDLVLNQGIVIQPYADERPILKGTLVATEWKNLGNGLWKTSWSRLFPAGPDDWWARDRFGKETPLHRFNNDMVFVDGRFLEAVGREGEVDRNSYYIDYPAGQVYIGTDPVGRVVEITAYNVALRRTTGKVHGKTPDLLIVYIARISVNAISCDFVKRSREVD